MNIWIALVPVAIISILVLLVAIILFIVDFYRGVEKENLKLTFNTVLLLFYIVMGGYLLICFSVSVGTFFSRVWKHVNTPYPQTVITGQVHIFPEKDQQLTLSGITLISNDLKQNAVIITPKEKKEENIKVTVDGCELPGDFFNEAFEYNINGEVIRVKLINYRIQKIK